MPFFEFSFEFYHHNKILLPDTQGINYGDFKTNTIKVYNNPVACVKGGKIQTRFDWRAADVLLYT